MGDPHRACVAQEVVCLFDIKNLWRVPLRHLKKKGRESSSHDLLTLITKKTKLQELNSSKLFYQRLFSESWTLTSR